MQRECENLAREALLQMPALHAEQVAAGTDAQLFEPRPCSHGVVDRIEDGLSGERLSDDARDLAPVDGVHHYREVQGTGCEGLTQRG